MLDYLLPYQDLINWEELLKLKEERNTWWDRESAKEFIVGELPDIQGNPSEEQKKIIEEKARQLIPWKKGPFNIHGLEIDAEWRSDYKWQRILKSLKPEEELKGKVVLDIGCNNGYFMFEMAKHNPELVMGFDPVLPMQAQFDFVQHFYKNKEVHFELFGVEHLDLFKGMFDTIFHMGIIYHHRHPIQQLIDIREALKPGGVVYLETIGIPGEESYALFPEDRFARMKNVWFVPTMSCFINWTKKARLIDVEIVADTDLTEDEQRATEWCPPPFKSLKDSLDPENPSLTVEGHPAPRRFLIKARKKWGQG